MRILFITRRFAPDTRGAVASTAARVYRDARVDHQVEAVIGYVRDRALIPDAALGVDLCGRRGFAASLALRRAASRVAKRQAPDVIVTTELDAPRTRRPAVAILVRAPEPGTAGARLAALRARVFARVVVPAAQVAEAFRHLGVPDDLLVVVPPAIDGDVLRVGEPRAESAVLRIACVGRIAPDKGQHLAIDAVARLPPADKARCHLDVVGTVGDPVYLEQLRVQASRQPISFHIDVEDTVPYHRGADLVLAPRLLNPTFPFAAAEASTAGTPVAWADHPDTRELLGDHGMPVPPGDVEALRDAVQRMLGSPEPIRQDATRARLRVLERCGRDAVWRRLEQVLNEARG